MTGLPGRLGRTGVITTPHGEIRTPAFIAVGTKATVKSVLPESMAELGAQAVLANAYHLYLQPGADIVDEAGGLGAFMNWRGSTFTDSRRVPGDEPGLGVQEGHRHEVGRTPRARRRRRRRQGAAGPRRRGRRVGSRPTSTATAHRFTPRDLHEVQHQIGADIMFAFDELTTLQNSRGYQEESLERTRRWAERCIAEHFRLTAERGGKPYQALFGVIQGAQYEDLRRKACPGSDLGAMTTSTAIGIGGALEKENLGTIVRLVQRGAAGGQAAAPAGHLRTRRLLHRDRERRGHLRLRLPLPGGPQLGVLHPDRPVQRHHGATYERDFGPLEEELRLLHLRQLHPGLPPPPVQGQGDARRRRCARSTTSASSSGWSTTSAQASTTATSRISRSASWRVTTPTVRTSDPGRTPADRRCASHTSRQEVCVAHQPTGGVRRTPGTDGCVCVAHGDGWWLSAPASQTATSDIVERIGTAEPDQHQSR